MLVPGLFQLRIGLRPVVIERVIVRRIDQPARHIQLDRKVGGSR